MLLDKTLIDQLIDLSYRAGAAILDVYASDDLGIRRKADDSPVTLADERSNRIICDGLRKLNPNIPIISEECTPESYEKRKDYTQFWLVDPLDGTKEFIRRTGEFTTNIALIENQKSVVGVIYAPVTNTLYWAVNGMGAYKIIGDDERQIFASNFDPKANKLRIATSRSHPCANTSEYINMYDNPTIVTIGSSLKMANVAEGTVDIYPRLISISEWDIAAGVCIVEESGGRMYQHKDETSIDFNTKSLRAPHFICEGKRIVDESKK